jgi:LysR family pca operon transcriptional activator
MIEANNWTKRLKIQQLRAVLAVAAHASLGRAASELGLTQSAITKILREIESEIGVALFVRTSRGTHCTEYGEILVAHVRAAFAQIDRAVSEISDAREGLSGHVRVGTLIAAAAETLPRAVAALSKDRPGLRVTVVEGVYDHLVPQLRRGELDLIAGRLPELGDRQGLRVELLYREQIAVVARSGHPAAGLAADLAQLSKWPWILPPAGTRFRQIVESAFLERGLPMPQAALESLSVLSNRCLVLETEHICPFPLGVIRHELDAGSLVRLPIDPPLWFGPVGITYRRDHPLSLAAEAFCACLRRAAQFELAGS